MIFENPPPQLNKSWAMLMEDTMGYRAWLQELWRKYEPYAPPDFQTHIENDEGKLDPLTWEMLLANNLLDAGFTLEKAIRSDSPDLCIMYNDKRIWIECCMPDRGTTADAVPEKKCDGEFHEVAQDKNTLRYASALKEKRNQYSRWLKNGICKPDEPFIIALHGRKLDFAIYSEKLPCILRALYSVGDMYVSFERHSGVVSEGYFHMAEITKTNGSPVDTGFFRNPENEIVSGVIFSKDWGKFHISTQPKYCYVKNIFAKNPAPIPFGGVMQEYDYTENSISLQPHD